MAGGRVVYRSNGMQVNFKRRSHKAQGTLRLLFFSVLGVRGWLAGWLVTWRSLPLPCLYLALHHISHHIPSPYMVEPLSQPFSALSPQPSQLPSVRLANGLGFLSYLVLATARQKPDTILFHFFHFFSLFTFCHHLTFPAFSPVRPPVRSSVGAGGAGDPTRGDPGG